MSASRAAACSGSRAGVPERAALAQEVPAAVELDLHRPQALLVLLEGGGVRAVDLLAVAQLVLLAHQAFDAGSNALVTHGSDLTPTVARSRAASTAWVRLATS